MIGLVYDQFGHPNQPFWLKMYGHLKKSDIEFKAFARNIMVDGYPEVSQIPVKQRSEIVRNIFLSMYGGHQIGKDYHASLKTKFSKTGTYFPLIKDKLPAIHFFNAQMFPEYEEILSLWNPRLVFSFRGYETLVRPFSDIQWHQQLLDIFRKGHKLHFVSDYIKDEAIKMGAEPEKCITIPHSVDFEFFKPAVKASGTEVKILTVGRLIWQKGYSYALEAIAGLKDLSHNVKYQIIGDGPDKDMLLYHIRRLRLEDHVDITGSMDQQAVKKVMQKADIYFHPSLSESLGVAIVEASGMELPVVASNVGGIPEIIIHQKTGLLVTSCAVEEMTENLGKLIESPTLRASYGTNGREFVSRKFSIENEIKAWLTLYSSLK